MTLHFTRTTSAEARAAFQAANLHLSQWVPGAQANAPADPGPPADPEEGGEAGSGSGAVAISISAFGAGSGSGTLLEEV